MHSDKHFLFVTIEGGGNVPAVLGLARRLADRGHRITVLSEPCMEDRVRPLGLDFIPFEDYFTRTDRKEDIFGDWKPRSSLSDPVLDNVVFGPTGVVAEETHRVLERLSVDVLAADCLLPGALIAAEALGIPSVLLFHFPEYMPGPNRPPGVMGLMPGRGPLGRLRDRLLGRVFHLALNKYLSLVNGVRAGYGLSRLRRTADLLDQADLRLIQTLREFDVPIDPAPENVRYTGPVLDDPDWSGSWSDPWPEDDVRPLVVLSLSSTFQNQTSTIQNALHALGGLEVRVLVTLGPAIRPEGFDVPDNAVMVQSAPHSEIFPRADLVITHAGHGTIMRALANGLPMLCLPFGRDQKDNAIKVVHRGLGLKLGPKSAPDKIRKAVQRILEEKSFRMRASHFQAKVRAAAQEDRAIQELEGLPVRRKPSVSVSR